MKYKYVLFIFSGLVFSLSEAHAQIQNPFSQSVAPRNAVIGPDVTELMKGAVEEPSKRTLFSSSYKAPGGKVICRYGSQIINYPDANGKLQPINVELKNDKNGWAADQQPYPCYLRIDKSTAIGIGNGEEVDFNINPTINGSTFSQNISSLEKNTTSLSLSNGINKKVTFLTNGIETDYTLDSSIGTAITISEELKYPSEYKLITDKLRGRGTKEGWTGDYIIVSKKDNSEVARFHAPLCYDSKGNWCIGSYCTQTKDGKEILTTIVPSSWLSKAVYPLVIDPLVTGPTAKWTGGSIPSCIFPSFSHDSIRVTIPAKITITSFIINYAYETNANIPVYLQDGKFYFSNSCRNNPSDTLSCDRDPGNRDFLPGTCYLKPGADFHCFLTSCYAPSCDSQRFYLTAHLARLAGGSGCDTDWVWYSKYIQVPYYQFMATVIGNTVQPDSVAPLVVSPTTQCSDICSLKMVVNAAYGVPPYRMSHPWDTAKYTVGAYSVTQNCTSIGTATFHLTIPNCPTFCGTNATLTVPPPLVIDACGDTAKGWPIEKVNINPTPKLATTPDTLNICNGVPIQFTFTSCVSSTSIVWTGSNGSSGTGDIKATLYDTSKANPYKVTYKVVGTASGCASDTALATVIINPYPSVTLKGKDTISVGSSSNLSASGGTTYLWLPAAGLSCTTCPNPTATPSATTVYYVTVIDKEGCSWVDSIRVVVLENQIIVPNVITPNGDGINDYLQIKGLQYYPNSSINIYDRWGKEVYSSSNYANNWGGGDQSDGVYFYVLTLNTGKKYQGYFQIIK